ncbi:unnamed protein product [Tilletia controversa]|nr:unnamed protein product [Tilletia controversa]
MDSSPQPDVISSEPWNVSTRPPALPLRLRGSKATAFGELVSRQLGSIHARRKSKILNYDRNKICEYNRDNVNPSHRQDDIAALFGIERLDGLAHYEGSGPLVGHQCLGGRSEYCQASAGRVQTYDLPSRIALPHIVIRELEGFKTGGRFDSVRIAARQANRWILACLQAQKRSAVNLCVSLAASTSLPVWLLSNDTNARTHADIDGIRALELEKISSRCATKRIMLARPPRLLVVHLNRSIFGGFGGGANRWILAYLQGQKRSVSTFLSKDAFEMIMRAAIAAGGAPTDVATAAEATTAALNPPVAWALHFETARQHKERMKEDPAGQGEAE